jgi:hypothetical protein
MVLHPHDPDLEPDPADAAAWGGSGRKGTPPPNGEDTGNDIDCIRLPPIGAGRIAPRPWAYGRFLLFGSAAVIGAVDGGGKGAIAVVMALAVITGRPLLGERVWRTGPVAIISYEDDLDEWHRRIAAACQHYDLDYQAVLANIHFLHRPHGDRIAFAKMVDGGIVLPDGDAIIASLKATGAVLLIVDPFNHCHALDDGNSNAMIAKVAGEVSRIAQYSGAAVLVLHHLRKGATGSTDDLMGATSLRATFRSCRILARMTAETAETMKITDPWRYIRISGSKENYAPPPEKATWFRLIGVPLGNGEVDPVYPDGDEVAVATTWQPRPLFEGMDAPTLRAVFEAIHETIHSPHKQAKQTPWVGLPLTELASRNDREATRIVKAWLASGLLAKADYYHEPSKHTVARVVLNEAKAAEILAGIEAINAPREGV